MPPKFQTTPRQSRETDRRFLRSSELLSLANAGGYDEWAAYAEMCFNEMCDQNPISVPR
jgi:hypothetical protein